MNRYTPGDEFLQRPTTDKNTRNAIIGCSIVAGVLIVCGLVWVISLIAEANRPSASDIIVRIRASLPNDGEGHLIGAHLMHLQMLDLRDRLTHEDITPLREKLAACESDGVLSRSDLRALDYMVVDIIARKTGASRPPNSSG